MALWTPADISTTLWLDASDSSTITLSSGDVSQWADRGGGALSAGQAQALERPVVVSGAQNGLDVIEFDGYDEWLLLSGAIDFVGKLVGVVGRASTQAYSQVFGHSTTNVQLRYSSGTSISVVGATPIWGNTVAANNATVANSMAVVVFNGAAAQGSLAVNGSAPATGGAQSTPVLFNAIGKRAGSYTDTLEGRIGEIVIADIGVIDQPTLEGYLAHKWGLAASLPVGHPYRWSPPGSVDLLAVRSSLEQPWWLRGDAVALPVAQGWGIYGGVAADIPQPWGLRLGRDLVEPWGNAPVRVAGMAQPWRDAGELARGLVQPWQDAAPLTAGLAQEWDILAQLALGLVQPWAVAADAALVGQLVQGWDLRDVVPISTGLAQPWTIGTDPALLRYTLTVTIDGHAVQADSLTLEADLDQDALHATISLGDLADYQRCRDLAPVVVRVAINGGTAEEYQLVQTSARIDERHGEARYEVQAESALVLLGEPYAEPVSVEEYTGAASVIAATLCAPLTLAWQTVDWTLPSGALVAAGETPLQLLKRLAAAVGAVVQARPDGSVRIAPEYPLSLPAWPTATPDLVWIETERSEQVAGQPERRAGYNKYLIGETLTAADSLRLEEETVSETVKIVRGYQVPWIGAFALVHTGGSWVQVEDLGIETRQETEVVEIVAGEGRVRYPIQSRDSVRWLHTSLGALTVSEDGTVRADVAGQSLCEITYTTRCRKWRVRDGRNEQLQLVAEI